jgi:hypothetical protein
MFSPASLGDVTTWYVSITGDDTNGGHSPEDALRTIGKAIEKAIADIEDDQEIIVLPGTYNEHDLFRYEEGAHDIDIYSQDGPETTIIDAYPNTTAFWLQDGEGRDITIDGFRLERAGGRAIRCDGASPTFRNCIIQNNDQGVFIDNGAAPLFENCEIAYNGISVGGGVYSRDSEPQFQYCNIHHNTGSEMGGGICFVLSSSEEVLLPQIHWCEITCNEVLSFGQEIGKGGGIYIEQGNQLFPIITHSIIAHNAAVQGGAIFIPGTSHLGIVTCYGEAPPHGEDPVAGQIVLDNSLVVGNSASGSAVFSHGGAILAGTGAQFRITNCTFGGNTAQARGGAVYSHHACTKIHNSIFWGDTAGDPTGGDELFLTDGGSNISFSHTILQGGEADVGGSEDWKIHNDFLHYPVYVDDPAFLTAGDCDYHLSPGSPGIDVGNNSVVPQGEVDLDGFDRIDDIPLLVVDLGCCEYQLGTCPIATILESSPADGRIDARQPHLYNDNSQGALQGIGDANNTISVRLTPAVAGADDPLCWALCESGTHGYDPNEILGVTYTAPDKYTFSLLRPISPGEATRIIYKVDESYVEYISHPGDVNVDSDSLPGDVLSLLDYLNEVVEPPAIPYSTDIDHSYAFDSFDVLRLLDLLNGAGTYDEWNETPQPEGYSCIASSKPCWCDCDPGYEGDCGNELLGMSSMPEGAPTSAISLSDVFAEYLANVDLTQGVQAEGYTYLVDGFCYWIVETHSVSERQALACRLTDPEFTCVSEAVEEDLPAIAARITE